MRDLRPLTPDEIAKAKGSLPAWTFAKDRIGRSLKFADFSEAFAMMCRIAMLAEKHDHHPEWSNVYNKVEIALSTHDIKGLSHKDVDLATAIDKLLA